MPCARMQAAAASSALARLWFTLPWPPGPLHAAMTAVAASAAAAVTALVLTTVVLPPDGLLAGHPDPFYGATDDTTATDAPRAAGRTTLNAQVQVAGRPAAPVVL
jgi:hypothetical protein